MYIVCSVQTDVGETLEDREGANLARHFKLTSGLGVPATPLLYSTFSSTHLLSELRLFVPEKAWLRKVHTQTKTSF